MDPITATLTGAGIGLGTQFAGNVLDWGFRGLTSGNWGGTSKERKNQIHDIRTLRRKEYQDMVHSLRQAGLNPILAVGASPGHATAQQVQQMPMPSGQGGTGAAYGQALASAKQAQIAESKAPSEIGKNIGATGLMGIEGQNLMLGRAGLLQQYEMNQLEMASKRQGTQTSALLGEVYKQDAIHKGASARAIEQRMREIDQYGLPGQTWEGLIRNRLTDATEKPGRWNLNGPADQITNSAKSILNWGSQFFGEKEK